MKALDLPVITIVTPSFNQAQFLPDCIESIVGQGYPQLEYVIMDGGSTDGSVEVIKRYESRLAYWQSQPDGGHYRAIADGFSRSKGEIMGWVNSDDKLHPDSLWLLAALFQAMPEVQWISGFVAMWSPDGLLQGCYEPNVATRERVLNSDFPPYIQQESTFWRRSLYNKIESQDWCRSYRLAGDFALWSAFLEQDCHWGVDLLLGGFRYQPNNRSRAAGDPYGEEAARVINCFRKRVGRGKEKQGGDYRVALEQLQARVFPLLEPQMRKRAWIKSVALRMAFIGDDAKLSDFLIRQGAQLKGDPFFDFIHRVAVERLVRNQMGIKGDHPSTGSELQRRFKGVSVNLESMREIITP